jgi:uncharacterized protein
MQSLDGRLIFSATDLNNYLECGHLVALERSVAEHLRARPEKDPTVALIAEKGLAHEYAYLERLRATHPDLVEIDASGYGLAAIEAAAAATEAAMAQGASVIYQGTFFDGTFVGKSDFLLRVETPCPRYPWSYEVADTKLALREKPYFIIQLAHYSEHVARVQRTMPEHMHVVLGTSEQKKFRVDDFAAYYRHLKASFLARGIASDSYPLVTAHCTICSWEDTCAQRRSADDHLSLVASMQNGQIARFEAAGTRTLFALGTPGVVRPTGMKESTFARLQRQASLQLRGREQRAYLYELLEHPPNTGFGLMPAPAPGDVFFDMEGDQFFEIGTGLEYLFGCYCPGDATPFKAFWGTDRAGEKAAFEACVDFLTARRVQYPSMHVYHYAPYEKSALRKLWKRHDTREAEVDALLKGDVLVDLYAVVRQVIAISQPSYSIKKLEPYYGMKRTADVRKGDDSILKFEEWLAHPERTEILADIEKYNEEDCYSTLLLRDWLIERRAEYAQKHGLTLAFKPVRKPDEPCHPEAVVGCKECERRVRDEREAAKISADQTALAARTGDGHAHLLAHLGSYHRREEKPAWWALFDRCTNLDLLVEFDREALGGLTFRSDIEPYKASARDRNLVYMYDYEDQLHNLGDKPVDPITRAVVSVVDIDEDAQTIAVKRGGTREEIEAMTALIPGGPVVATPQKLALARVAAQYLDESFAQQFPAARDLLTAATPRLRDRAPGATIQPAIVSWESVLAAVSGLDRSYLFVQGPPGTGKTYTGARVIVQLLAAGKRVGVMATGHKAIHNMLHAIERYAFETQVAPSSIVGVHKASTTNTNSPYESELAVPYITTETKAETIETGSCNLISGNGWFFSRDEMIAELDYLFIDEAGQLSLAEAIAVAPAAQNIVLLGDPGQLAQVRQGDHVGNAGASVLEHILGDAATIAPDRGILLDVSYRMHPEICAFVSQTSYDGRLHALPETAQNRVTSEGLSGCGLRAIAVEHVGNGRESAEEAACIRDEVALLLAGTFVRKGEPAAALTQRDILIVTPYNAQRKAIESLLRSAGFADVRVGTVDKFQGQEAPVVFYSMATSSGDDLPRNMEFLFDKNRFNVAISRAQCLSVLVYSPRLLDIRCATTEQMALANMLCRYVETVSVANV